MTRRENLIAFGWKVAVAFVQGSAHTKLELPCQDYSIHAKTDDVVCIALADGAGSCRLSDIGAKVACQVVSRELTTKFAELFELDNSELAASLLKAILIELKETAELLENKITELSSTLLFSVVCNGRYIAGHIGDGVIGIQNGAEVSVLSEPYNGEYSNTTVFVTSQDALKNFRIYKGVVGSESGFILMSDGSSASLYDKRNNIFGTAVPIMLEWLFNFPEAHVQEALLENLENIIGTKTTDDCSIALMKYQSTPYTRLLSFTPKQQSQMLGALKSQTRDIKMSVIKYLSEQFEPITFETINLNMPDLANKILRRQLAELIKRDLVKEELGFYSIPNNLFICGENSNGKS